MHYYWELQKRDLQIIIIFLKKISKIAEFEDDTYLFFKQILNLEIRNFLSSSQRKKLEKEVKKESLEVVKLSPELELLVSGNLKEVSEKNAELIRIDAVSQGLSVGDGNARREIAEILRVFLGLKRFPRRLL